MLKNASVYAYVPTLELERAKRFYAQKLGLEPSGPQSQGGANYQLTNETAFFMYQTPNAGTSKASQLFFKVEDVAAEVKSLKERGVTFEDYGPMGGEAPKDNIYTTPGGRVAWFKDSEGNIIALTQEA